LDLKSAKLDKRVVDGVQIEKKHPTTNRELDTSTYPIKWISSNFEHYEPTHEFFGAAKFSKQGVELCKSIIGIMEADPGKWNKSINLLDINDLFQEMIARSCNVRGLEIHKGWVEIRSLEDIVVAEELL